MTEVAELFVRVLGEHERRLGSLMCECGWKHDPADERRTWIQHRAHVAEVLSLSIEQVGEWCDLHGLCEVAIAEDIDPASYPANTPVFVARGLESLVSHKPEEGK